MTQPTTHRMNFRDLLRSALKDKPLGMNQAELMQVTEAAQSQVSRALTALREPGKREIYIIRWERAKAASGPPIAYYALGAEDDARCTLPKIDGKERVRSFRERERERRIKELDADGWPVRVSPQGIPNPHPIMRALYGMEVRA